ncbi:protein STRUBBELIG-RECEPTOR FAMILY 3-like [Andrographis paniculata]|uniref:protein STRUBBELIG-RECEPTOR FAMILY 3-like n=1 Tax=Andrographis paniculata TaxID=175694 RepID=UPI0021E749EA|nr:protein STRUBBELIG-RECEPTOR FAMILY 3-like [Andrographis paniculata]
MMACLRWRVLMPVVCLLVALCSSSSWGLTDPRDVYAITQLYAFLGSPLLPGWIPGGDPCGPPSWQGVECVNENITAVKLSGANLGGVLPEDLGSFASIILIDLSNNHIEGSLPTVLPITLRSLFLSSNNFTGRIPDTLSSLAQLTDLSLNHNQLIGPIPDSFLPLTNLINMDLSNNDLTGALPSSMGNLTALTTLHLQDNQLSGLLDVLQDLPLTELNIENNLFSGPIPDKLLSIPSFRKDGNPFNTTVLPSPPALSPSSPSVAPSPHSGADIPHSPPSSFPDSGNKTSKKVVANKFVWISIAGLLVIVLVLVSCLCIHRCCKAAVTSDNDKRVETTDAPPKTMPKQNPLYQAKKATEKSSSEPVIGSRAKNTVLNPGKDHNIDMTMLDVANPPRARPLPLVPSERIVANPTFSPLTLGENSSKMIETAKFFTIASLQQYTDSFSQENLIGKGTLGAVYSARLPDGKVLAVKKLDNAASGHLSDSEFLELVSRISRFKHENILELVGYCLEHRQRLLVYNFCRNGTLDDALNCDDEINKRLSWNARLRLALQAAKALEYLHEVCRPPVVHQNFKSCNVLLEDDLTVRISDCGLAPLLPPYSMAQLQGSGYGAPELEQGSYSLQSDVYSFGVVMLQLITGRKSLDRSRPRSEQNLARWAFLQLHDIDSLSRMVDPSLNGTYSSMSLSRVADIISMCIQPQAEFRPPMSEIVQKLLQMVQRDS